MPSPGDNWAVCARAWASGQVHHPRTRVPVPRPRGVAVVTGEAHGGGRGARIASQRLIEDAVGRCHMPGVDYDESAQRYDEPSRDHEADSGLAAFLAEPASVAASKPRVLDIGCGTGKQIRANRVAKHAAPGGPSRASRGLGSAFGGGRRVCHGAPATSAPVDHASRASWGRTARPPVPVCPTPGPARARASGPPGSALDRALRPRGGSGIVQVQRDLDVQPAASLRDRFCPRR